MAGETQNATDLEVLRGIDSPTINNAIDSLKVRDATEGFASSDLRCVYPGFPPMVGYAVTCTDETSTSRSEPGRGYRELYEAIQDAPKPVVVVFKCIGDSKRSLHMGDVMGSIVARLGAVGVVTDGGVRDVAAVRERIPGFQMFSTGFVVGGGSPSLGDIGVTLSICGLTIRPGDLLHGDGNGLLTVPAGSVADVVRAAKEIQAREAARIEYVRSAEFSIDGLTSGH